MPTKRATIFLDRASDCSPDDPHITIEVPADRVVNDGNDVIIDVDAAVQLCELWAKNVGLSGWAFANPDPNGDLGTIVTAQKRDKAIVIDHWTEKDTLYSTDECPFDLTVSLDYGTGR